MKLFVALALFVAGVLAAEEKAVVKIVGEKVEGLVKFTKTQKGVEVEGEIKGLTPGKHGFHIHQLGDLSDGCASTKGHFNPHNKNHGAPNATVRHVGDLGNILADENGVAKILMVDDHLDFDGVNNIIGRAVVVHSGEDDLGHGGEEDSLTTGHAGGRVGCGVIGRATDGGGSVKVSSFLAITFSSLLSVMVTTRLQIL